ncbi:MAG TPA: acetylglutamate kinase [Thermoanaerobaculia bacterium]|nr:acetylglutamate kinase [Thermoanaerobaculia bacterium]
MSETPESSNSRQLSISQEVRGAALAEALGYVAAWRRLRVVVKYGGHSMTPEGEGTLIEDVALLHRAGVRVVLVHGGGPEISELLERLGVPGRFVDGLRVTDEPTMRVVEMVLGGGINKRLVGRLQAFGARAVGLSGKDGDLLQAVPHERAELGLVGRVAAVDTGVLTTLLDGGFVPVIAPLARGAGGVTYNVNADLAAAAIAGALEAEKFLLLTDVPGVLDVRREPPSLLSELRPGEARTLIAEGVISRGMIPKVESCLSAIDRGVRSAHILSAATPRALLLELFTDAGIGTMIRSHREGGRRQEPAPRQERAGGEPPETGEDDPSGPP